MPDALSVVCINVEILVVGAKVMVQVTGLQPPIVVLALICPMFFCLFYVSSI
jgi:hypothetical protein